MTATMPSEGEVMSSIFEPPNTEEVLCNLMRYTTQDTTGEAENPMKKVVTDWLGTDPTTLPGHLDWYSDLQHVNLQRALESFLAVGGRESEILGVLTATAGDSGTVSFSTLLTPVSFSWSGSTAGLVDTSLRPCGYEKYMRCIDRGLVLFRDDEGCGAILVSRTNRPPMMCIEVLTNPPERAPQLIEHLQELSNELSPYHREFFRIRSDGMQGLVPEFMRRPEPMTADDIILPEGLLAKINQHTIAVARNRKKLRRLGMHLKRGILLYGPPGTGKTHTIRYLASNMPESTVVIVPKQALAAAATFLPFLEPAVFVLDDIDLVAENRALPGLTERGKLFEVLDVLDGLHDTADVLFVLSTNRIDTMEPAIAARPGRVDQTIEINRPDAECRRRLFRLYARGLDVQVDEGDVTKVIERTDGVTASFFKELFRRSTVKAVKRGGEGPDGDVTVSAELLFEALDQMLDIANPMTRFLLGADPEHDDLAVDLREA